MTRMEHEPEQDREPLVVPDGKDIIGDSLFFRRKRRRAELLGQIQNDARGVFPEQRIRSSTVDVEDLIQIGESFCKEAHARIPFVILHQKTSD